MWDVVACELALPPATLEGGWRVGTAARHHGRRLAPSGANRPPLTHTPTYGEGGWNSIPSPPGSRDVGAAHSKGLVGVTGTETSENQQQEEGMDIYKKHKAQNLGADARNEINAGMPKTTETNQNQL